MNILQGHLSDYFVGVGAKRLAAVDTQESKSNQHEVNGSKKFLELLGATERTARNASGKDNRYPARFIWMGDENETISEVGLISWYDTRKKKKHRSPEWRLYYQNNAITSLMREGDSLFIALNSGGDLLFIVAPENSTSENQLLWLFGFSQNLSDDFSIKGVQGRDLGFAANFILNEIGEDLDGEDPELDVWLKPLRSKFPPTLTMSELARRSLPLVNPAHDPDLALVSWLQREEQLFRRLEYKVVRKRLQNGFYDGRRVDVDGFISFSMSVQNRRKARMGYSLENHLEHIFLELGIVHDRGKKTENNAKPDFLFPGQAQYLDTSFEEQRLTMLGAKSTCKDRWRQVLSEAERIGDKHLLTLEPSISVNQTDQMQAHNLQLVLPSSIHKTYTATQQSWLMTLGDFIQLVKSRN